MSATLLSDLPQTVCDAISGVLTELKACKPHAGKFNIEELKRKGIASPAVLVSLLGAKPDKGFAGSAHALQLQMAAYVVVRDGLGKPRDVRAANICQALLSLVPENVWGQPALGAAREVHMHCLVSGKAKDHGASLWAVTWAQPVTFFEPEIQPLGVDLYVAQAPEVGADHVDDYELVGEDG